MSGFAAASVLGVPLGLELARQASWRAPFFAVALLGVFVGVYAIAALPELRLHMTIVGDRAPILEFLRERTVLFSLGATFSVMVSSFCIIPNLSAYLQFNWGFPRSGLSLLYLVGGSVSFIMTRFVGGYVDRLGSTRVAAVGSGLFIAVVLPSFLLELRWLPVMLIFVLFMTATAVRNVSISALTSRVPQPHERARFMSLQSAVQHLAAAGGSGLGSVLLTELPNDQLGGMPRVAAISVAFAAILPVLLWQVERVIRLRRPSLPEPWMVALEATRSSFPPTA
jgi:predicted MFS family arabinose efflux permease